jgi:membrane protein
MSLADRLLPHLEPLYERLDQAGQGIPAAIRRSVTRFGAARGAEAAAAIAYYAIFSIFPLLMVFNLLAGLFFRPSEATERVIMFFTQASPALQSTLREFFLASSPQVQAVSWLAPLTLIWSASGVFNTLTRSVNRAWPSAKGRSYIQNRLIALGIILILLALLLVWLVTVAVLNLLPLLNIPILGRLDIYRTWLWRLLTTILPWALGGLFFFAIYRWLPNTHVQRRDAAWSALAATLLWQVTSWGFTLYLRSSFSNFQWLYGSLGTGVALLLWVYLSAMILLWGAHFSAALANRRETREGNP